MAGSRSFRWFRNVFRGGGAVLGALVMAVAWNDVRGDDDDPGWLPPFDPGSGFEGILPNPPADPGLAVDQTTSPYGVRQVFNTPATIMGQSFRPAQGTIDWIGFVFQNNTQPDTTAGPGSVRALLYSSLNETNGVLDGLLGTSDSVSLASDSTAWLVFRFPEAVVVTPGETYYCRLEMVDGYPCWAGGRLENFYSRGEAFGYLPDPYGRPPQNLRWRGYDLVFAAGSWRPAEVSDGYIEWCALHGLEDTDPSKDPDFDGVPNLEEFLRIGDPLSSADLGKRRAHFVESGGERFWALTVATPAALQYDSLPDGTLVGASGETQIDRFFGSVNLADASAGRPGLLEWIPAVTEGLPPLPVSHVYRTFRLDAPLSVLPQGFIVNRMRAVSGAD